MEILLIGGTGTISLAISRSIVENGDTLYLLNRGSRVQEMPEGAQSMVCDARDEAALSAMVQGMQFDVVVDFIAMTPEDVARDFRVFQGRVGQYIFISSASVYIKPPCAYLLTEDMPLGNPYWQYARDKIACEHFLMDRYAFEGFPVTIVRPSHTYDERSIPFAVRGNSGCWQVLKRMREGREVIVPGDGTSLWTLTHSQDFARGFCALLGNPNALGEAFHITSDEALSWNQIYALAALALGVEPKFAHVSSQFLAQCREYDFTGSLLGDKAYSSVFDNTKIRTLAPDYHAQISFREGAEMTISHILATPALQREDPQFDAWCDRVIAAQHVAVDWVNHTHTVQ